MELLNLDKILGTTINPVSPYLSAEQEKAFQGQQLFDTLIGAGSGYQSQLYQNKGFFDKALGLLQGARQGRQSTVDLYTKAIQSQFGIQKDLADLQKTSMENQFLKLKQAGIEDAIRNTNDPQLINSYFIDPVGTAQQILKVDMPAPSFSESLGVKAIGGNARNLTQDEALLLKQAEGGLTQKDILGARIEGIKEPALGEALKTTSMPTAADILSTGTQRQNIPSEQRISYTPPTEIRLPSPRITDRVEPIVYQNQGGFTITEPTGQVKQQPTVPYSGTAQRKAPQQQIQMAENFQNTSNEFNNQNPIVDFDLEYSPKRIQEYKDKFPEISLMNTRVLQEYNDAELQIDRLLNHEGFEDLFSAGGDIARTASRSAQAAGIIWDRIKSSGVANTLKQQKLEDPNGATPYGQMNYSELILVKQGYTELPNAGTNPDSAKAALLNLKDIMNKSRQGILSKHSVIYGSQGTDRFENRIVTNFETNAGTVYLGSVLQGKLYGNKGIEDNYYYIQAPDGNLRLVKNPKNKDKPLTKQDMLKQGFQNIFKK